MKRLILALSAGLTAVLALDKIGTTPIAPGTDLDFAEEALQVSGKSALRLSADAGRLECWIHLELAGLPGAVAATAQIRGGEPVATDVHALSAGGLAVDVFKGGSQAASTRPFAWPPGAAIDVAFDVPAGVTPVVQDWTVFLTTGEAETRGRHNWRKAWFWISLVCLAGAVLAGIYSAWPEAKVMSARDSVELIINGIEGADLRQTRHMRKILRLVVLEGVHLKEALDTIPGSFKRKREIWIKAKNQFQARLSSLIAELTRAHQSATA